MTQPINEKPILLILVSHDFGELGLAKSFIVDLQESWSIYFLLPEKMHTLNAGIMQNEAIVYRNAQDIEATFNRLHPEAMLFFSAYLLVPNKIFTVTELKTFIAKAKTHCRVLATSDPFLGITRTMQIKDIELANVEVTSGLMSGMHKFYQRYLASSLLRKVDNIIGFLPRLIPIADKNSADDPNCWLFHSKTPPAHFDTDSHWVFVLSDIDVYIQSKVRGRNTLLYQLQTLIHFALQQEKIPIIIGAGKLHQELYALNIPQLVCWDELNIRDFKSTINAAERVFYWNIISNSIYERMLLGKPIHFLDHGHIMHMFPRLYKKAIQCYYGGASPQILNLQDELSLSSLDRLAQEFYAHQTPVIEAIIHYPSPATFLQHS